MKTAILFVTALAASAAVAQQQEQAAQAPPPPGHSAPSGAANAGLDPDETICRNRATVGSRLARVRTCQTRAQWAAQIQGDRSLTEKAQTTRVWCERGAC